MTPGEGDADTSVWPFDGSAMTGWKKKELVAAGIACGLNADLVTPDTVAGWTAAITALAAQASETPVAADGVDVLRAYCAVNKVAIAKDDNAAAIIVKIEAD